jgi:hypothetical protein
MIFVFGSGSIYIFIEWLFYKMIFFFNELLQLFLLYIVRYADVFQF